MDIIVATGNVTLEADFTGTIVAKGRIIVKKTSVRLIMVLRRYLRHCFLKGK